MRRKNNNKIENKGNVFRGFTTRISNYILSSLVYPIRVGLRFCRRMVLRTIRVVFVFIFRLWIKEVNGFENLPLNGPAILVSNHRSYFDFFIIGCLLKRYIVFIANNKIRETFFVGWFTKTNYVIYIEPDNPGIAFFRDIIRHLELGRFIIIYPEGTRSRSGKMLSPKDGFVKLAMKTKIPIIPVAIKGAYDILPPSKHLPRFKRCSVTIGHRINISPDEQLFKDIFIRSKDRGVSNFLDREGINEIAFRIMDKIRILAEERWDEVVLVKEKTFKNSSRSN